MKNLLIVTDLSFPKGSAMASRILSFCHLFNDLGYKVHAITGKYESSYCRYDEIIEEDFYSYEVVKSNRSYRLQSYIGNENLAYRVEDYLNENEVDLVFTTSLNAVFGKVLNICKKYNKKIIVEQCEWYDSSSFTFGRLDPRYLRFLYNITFKYIKADGIISISRLLNNYFESKNVKTTRIASILDVQYSPYTNTTNNEKIEIVYTGNTSKSKELLKPIFEALSFKQEYLNKINFNIYGSNINGVLKNINNDKDLYNKVKNSLFIHGSVPQEKIKDILLKADYQMFIRPNRRSSNAGFPTKLAESMAVGTPVISNYTGDIELYLKDNINGLVCDGITCEDVKKIFDKIINMSKGNYSILRRNARLTAEENFDYRKYLNQVKELVDSL